MKISVFTPTRKRYKMLTKGIDSIINNVDNLSNIEFLFRFDVDDISTMKKVMRYYNVDKISTDTVNHAFKWGSSRFKVINTFSKKFNVSMRFIYGKRWGYSLLNRCNDESMYVAKGEYLFHWTDDFELLHNEKYSGWDTLIREGRGQNYIFFFRDANRKRKPAVGPISLPKKWFIINNRLCPNVLDDWWYEEICKILPKNTRVVLDWEMRHNNVWKTDKEDITSAEGRDVFNRDRESNIRGYEYYSEKEMEKIKKYIEDNPNTKKTSQLHDNSFCGQRFCVKQGGTGRWSRK